MLCNGCTSCHFSMSNLYSIGLEKELSVAPFTIDLSSFTFLTIDCIVSMQILFNILKAKMTIEKKMEHVPRLVV